MLQPYITVVQRQPDKGKHLLKNITALAMFLLAAVIAPSAVFSQPNISRVEYYMDTDPGFGNATPLTITPGTNLPDLNIAINQAALTEGVHRLNVRAQNASGHWSLTNTWLFYKPYGNGIAPPPPPPATNITRVEYYLDTDPGFGNATSMAISPGTNLQDLVIPLNPGNLTEGVHRLHIRARNANGNWSLNNTLLFYKPYGNGIAPPPPPAATNITRLEYYLDTDPGKGNATALSITPGTNLQDLVIPVNAATLSEGVHRLHVRALNANGNWSLTNTWLFYKPYSTGVPPQALPVPKMNRLEYFVDTDPGYGKAVPVALDSLIDFANYVVPVNVTGLETGNHTLWVRGLDKNGKWGMMNNWDFTVPATLAAPAIVVNSVTDKLHCARDSFDISYDATGIYNSGNIFKAELSDATGIFPATPVIIGSFAGTASAIIKAKLPAHTANGSAYKVRIVSTNPIVTGLSGSDAITIYDRPAAKTITGRTQVNGTFTWPYSLAATAGSTWVWQVNGGIQTSGTNTNAINVLWAQPALPSGAGNMNVIETNEYGCVGDTSTLLPVTIYKLAIKDTVAASYCKAGIIDIKTGATGAFDAGNNLIAELSNSSGSFASPLTTASIVASSNGVNQLNTISITIPFSVPNGIGYRIRVRSTSPAFTGDTSAFISILKPDLGSDLTRTYCIGRGYNLLQNFTDASLTYSYYDQSFTILTRPDSVEAGVYQVIGTNSQGCRDTAMLTLNGNPTPALGADTYVYHDCPGETTNLNPLFNTSGLTVQWNTGNTSAAPPGTYRLIVTNGSGCTDTAFAYVILEVATWTGALSSSWHNPGNWNIGKVPTLKTHVIIAAGTPNPCIISAANAEAASIQIRNGATLRATTGRVMDIKGRCAILPSN